MTPNDVRAFIGIQARGNAVEVCGSHTGHAVRAIAFCDSPETAARISDAIKLAIRASVDICDAA
jgi:hypothetical protein